MQHSQHQQVQLHTEPSKPSLKKKPKLETKILNVSSAADASKGPRDYMEDTHTIRDDIKFYGVYDGHGGEQAAKLTQEAFINGKIEDAIHEAFLKVDKHILKESQDNKWDSGTTAVVALIEGTKLYIANCGDSEAVLGRRKIKSSSKSRPSRPTTPLSFALSESCSFSPGTTPRNYGSENQLSGSSCSLTDSLGISPTAVLSHLSLASPRKASPRFRSRNNSLCSDGTPELTAENITPTSTPPNISLLPNTPVALDLTNNETTINHCKNTQDNNPQSNTKENTNPTNHTNSNSSDRTTHKRKDNNNSDREVTEEEEVEEDEESFEDEPTHNLTDDIEAYLKDNPNSFFCQSEGQCGIFEPIVLSCCHRPNSEDEVKRIDAAGGAVSYGRVSGELAVTRSFGDINYKHPHNKGTADFVSVKPHIRVFDLQPHDEFLILASDGLWDVLSHKEAIDVISKSRSFNDSRQACEDLVDEALRKNSFDNVTVVFLSFKWSNSS